MFYQSRGDAALQHPVQRRSTAQPGDGARLRRIKSEGHRVGVDRGREATCGSGRDQEAMQDWLQAVNYPEPTEATDSRSSNRYRRAAGESAADRKSTRLNSSHLGI